MLIFYTNYISSIFFYSASSVFILQCAEFVVDDADDDVTGRQSKRLVAAGRRATVGTYIPMLTELGQ